MLLDPLECVDQLLISTLQAYSPTTEHLNSFREEKGDDVANHPDDLNQ